MEDFYYDYTINCSIVFKVKQINSKICLKIFIYALHHILRKCLEVNRALKKLRLQTIISVAY